MRREEGGGGRGGEGRSKAACESVDWETMGVRGRGVSLSLLHGVGDEHMHVLPLVQQHHGSEVAHSLVCVLRRSYQLETLQLRERDTVQLNAYTHTHLTHTYLSEVSRVAQDVDVQQFGHIARPRL